MTPTQPPRKASRACSWRKALIENADSVIRSELQPDERLLWSGQPPQGVRLRAADAFLIPFSLMWGGFAIFWEATAILSGAPLFFLFWGIPFVVMGLYLIVGRFWVDAWQRSRTCYGITDSRVIIVSGVFSRNTRSQNIRTLSDITLTARRNGSGTISFGPVNPYYGWWGGAGWPGMERYAAPCLELASGANEVYAMILAVQKVASSPSNS